MIRPAHGPGRTRRASGRSSGLFALLFILFAGTNLAAQESGGPDAPASSIAVRADATTDAAITDRIRGILRELDDYGDVTVTVASGIVTLRGTTVDAAASAGLAALVTRVEGVVAIRNQVVATTDVARRLDPAFDRFLSRLTQTLAYLPLLAIALLAGLVVIAAGILLARMKQPWERLAPNSFIADIYRQIVRLVFVLAAVVVGLDILNATALLSTILGAAGIVGLALGFAVKDTVENFIASVMLSVRQPFQPNDTVEIDGDEGKVIRLTSRATILLSYDGNQIRIPNATVFKSRIVNFSRNPERRFTFALGVAPDADLALAVARGREVIAALPFSLASPLADSWISDVGDSTVTLCFAGWIDQRNTGLAAARSVAIRAVMAALTEAAIAMPEPTYRVVGLDASAGPASVSDPGGQSLRRDSGSDGIATTPPAAATGGAAAGATEVSGPGAASDMTAAARADQDLKAMVEAERRIEDNDLLTRAAPME